MRESIELALNIIINLLINSWILKESPKYFKHISDSKPTLDIITFFQKK